MLEGFTDEARRAVVGAQELALHHGHARAEDVHLLGGVLQGDVQVSRRLRQAGLASSAVVASCPRARPDHRYFLGESLQRAALRARVEATIARDPEVTSQHLVLALLQQPAVVAAVEAAGINTGQVRACL